MQVFPSTTKSIKHTKLTKNRKFKHYIFVTSGNVWLLHVSSPLLKPQFFHSQLFSHSLPPHSQLFSHHLLPHFSLTFRCLTSLSTFRILLSIFITETIPFSYSPIINISQLFSHPLLPDFSLNFSNPTLHIHH